MKTHSVNRTLVLFSVCALWLELSCCTSNQKFKIDLEEKSNKMGNGPDSQVMLVMDYSVVMNEKGSSNFRFRAVNGNKYIIRNLNSAQLTAIFLAMNHSKVEYDTTNHEFHVKGKINEFNSLKTKVDSLAKQVDHLTKLSK